MKITKAQFYEINKDKLKSFVSITIDNELVISGLKVMDSVNGYFVAMPSRKNSKDNDGSQDYKAYIDTVYPITKEARTYIQDTVLKAYHEFMQSNEQNDPYVEVPRPNAKHQERPSIEVDSDLLPF